MCHVLIIEDEAIIAMQIQDLLEDQGATSFSFAASADEAVAAAHEHMPELITSDVNLAPGNGPAAVDRIIDALGPIPVMYITGSPDECVAACPDAMVLAKPVSSRVIGNAYHHLMHAAA